MPEWLIVADDVDAGAEAVAAVASDGVIAGDDVVAVGDVAGGFGAVVVGAAAAADFVVDDDVRLLLLKQLPSSPLLF